MAVIAVNQEINVCKAKTWASASYHVVQAGHSPHTHPSASGSRQSDTDAGTSIPGSAGVVQGASETAPPQVHHCSQCPRHDGKDGKVCPSHTQHSQELFSAQPPLSQVPTVNSDAGCAYRTQRCSYGSLWITASVPSHSKEKSTTMQETGESKNLPRQARGLEPTPTTRVQSTSAQERKKKLILIID